MDIEAGLFTFEGRYANGEDTDEIIFTGTNEAAAADKTANIKFDTIDYTTAELKQLVAKGNATKDSDGNYHIMYVITEKAANDIYQFNPQTFTMEVIMNGGCGC